MGVQLLIDSDKIMIPGYFPIVERKAMFTKELFDHSEFFFGKKLASETEVNSKLLQQGGLNVNQFLAYVRIGFGDGDCPSLNDIAGISDNCKASAYNFQTALQKGLDLIPNIRYFVKADNKWKNTLTQNQEDVAYSKVFDHIAKNFSGKSYNPLRDVILDVSSEDTYHCTLLKKMMANGSALESYLLNEVQLPSSLAKTLGNLIDGVTEPYEGRTFHYGLFYFLNGSNCSRLEKELICYEGEPKLYGILTKTLGIPIPQENGSYHWSCKNIASMIDVMATNIHGGSYDYNIFDNRTENNYQFTGKDFSRQRKLHLTAEELLMFQVGLSNAQINSTDPDLTFSDNIPVADIENMFLEGVVNPEYEFQDPMFKHIFDLFL